jgi:hypothetical protein
MAKAIILTPRSLYFMEIPLGTIGQETDSNPELLRTHFETHNFVPQAGIEPLPAVFQLIAWSLQRLVPYYGKKNPNSASGIISLSLQKLYTFLLTNKTSDVSVH